MVFYRSNELSKFRGHCAVLLAALPSLHNNTCIMSVIYYYFQVHYGGNHAGCEWSCLSRSSVSAPTAGSAGLTV